MNDEEKKKGRVSRLKRSPRPIELKPTPRQVALIAAVNRYRFLTSRHLAALDGGGAQKVKVILRDLYDAHLLDRIAGEGNHKSQIYALGNRGADLLSQEYGLRRAHIDWRDKNRTVKYQFVEHTLLNADLMVAIEVAAKRSDGAVRMIHPDEIVTKYMPPSNRDSDDPFTWSAPVDGHAGTITPDAVFALSVPGLDEDRRAKLFFVEADTGSEPITSKNIYRSFFVKKIKQYARTHRDGHHKTLFGFAGFRVLTLTKGAERASNLARAAHDVTDGSRGGLFLFTDHKQLLDGDPFDTIWSDPTGQRTSPIF